MPHGWKPVQTSHSPKTRLITIMGEFPVGVSMRLNRVCVCVCVCVHVCGRDKKIG